MSIIRQYVRRQINEKSTTEKDALKLVSDIKAFILSHQEDVKLGNYPNLQKAIIELQAIIKGDISDIADESGKIIDAKWSTNHNDPAYQSLGSVGLRDSVLGARNGKEIIENIEKRGGILNGWGIHQAKHKLVVLDETPHYIKLGWDNGTPIIIIRDIKRA